MKKISFLVMAAAALVFAACSSDKDAVAEGGNTNWSGTGEGYFSLNIKLPTTPLTRAANDSYDDGLAAEYKVTDACLLLFQKSTGDAESAATLVSAQKLDLGTATPDADNDNITTEYQTVAEVSGTIDNAKELFALVCVNYKDVISITSGTPTVAGTGLVKGTSTYADFLALTTDNSMVGASKDYFFMTNAVTSTKPGAITATAPTKDNIFTLALLDKTKIYPTKAEAATDGNEAASIFVERAVAKATLSVGTGLTKVADAYNIATTNGVMWSLNNTEPTSFIVRNMGDLTTDYLKYSSEAFPSPYYRMVGNVKYGTTSWVDGTADLYRTYWCIDPQYDTDATLNLTASTYIAADGSTPQYCHENTFDVAHQNYQNTTRAVVKVTLEDDATFYGVNESTSQFNEADAKTYFANAVVNDARIKKFFKDNLVAGHSFTATAADFTLTYTEPVAAEAGYVVLSGITLNTASTNLTGACPTDLNFTDAATAKTSFDALTSLSTIISEINHDIKVKKYVGGVMYYTARFEHLANTAYEAGLGTYGASAAQVAGDLAPWNCWETAGHKPIAGSTTSSYPAGASKTAEENYLGRYGMVRNNWYDAQITAIPGLGEPVDPSLTVDNPGTPDDNPKSYISVKIHILSWAKRTQSWSF